MQLSKGDRQIGFQHLDNQRILRLFYCKLFAQACTQDDRDFFSLTRNLNGRLTFHEKEKKKAHTIKSE